MNKKQLIESIAVSSGENRQTVEGIVDAVFDTIASTLAAGDKVQISNFGTFKRHLRKAREYRNPQTGVGIEKEASFDARFASARALEERMNE